ncbi:hypothetical protein L2E82_42517 [Cichorium intybus]|uniref:Uncharacterized protein n=1 Tax=Cichorium intybus TaxID=13427 RepID=A0ACB8ZM18_CICIN|nr:hypothetical protein L2E82_42517 [Cichorium intybus]
MRDQLTELKTTDISNYQKVANKRIAELEATRDLSRIWLHVDMDAFYAAVETLSNPSLKGKPMAVGSMSMISTARKFGVRAGMPGFIACKLCPDLIFVPTDFKKYTYYSDLTRKVYHEYDPNFTAANLDEAYLDITKVCKEKGITGGEVAEELRENVYKATCLTCSAGIAPNRCYNDIYILTSCTKDWGNCSFLCALFSPSSASLGLGGTDPPNVRSRKSISNERTFSATKNEAFFNQKLVELADMLYADMEKECLHGRTLTLKLKTASFEMTRAFLSFCMLLSDNLYLDN